MKRVLFTIFFFGAAGSLSAQQLETSSFYELQGLLANPSLAGTGRENVIGINYRSQWNNLEGAPKTATAFGSFALPKEKLGIGGNIYSDKTGPTSRAGLDIAVAKHIYFRDSSILSLGIDNRFQQFMINQTELAQTLGNDPAIGNVNNSIKYDVGFGVSYTSDRFQIGASVAQLLQTKQNNYSGTIVRSQEARLYRHYFLNGSYKFDLDPVSTVTPNFLIVYLPNAPTEYNFGAKYEFQEIFGCGLGFTATGNVSFSLGLRLVKNFSIDYAYQIYNNPSDKSNSYVSANEFMLRYFFHR